MPTGRRAAPPGPGMDDNGRVDDITRIERELTVLASRARTIHVSKPAGDVELDRAAYGVLLRLEEEGSLRLGQLARLSGVDPSTITRQVQALERLGLVERSEDPRDRRACRLGLSEEGRSALADVQGRRRGWLDDALAGWSSADRHRLGALLGRLNDAIGEQLAPREEELRTAEVQGSRDHVRGG